MIVSCQPRSSPGWTLPLGDPPFVNQHTTWPCLGSVGDSRGEADCYIYLPDETTRVHMQVGSSSKARRAVVFDRVCFVSDSSPSIDLVYSLHIITSTYSVYNGSLQSICVVTSSIDTLRTTTPFPLPPPVSPPVSRRTISGHLPDLQFNIQRRLSNTAP